MFVWIVPLHLVIFDLFPLSFSPKLNFMTVLTITVIDLVDVNSLDSTEKAALWCHAICMAWICLSVQIITTESLRRLNLESVS